MTCMKKLVLVILTVASLGAQSQKFDLSPQARVSIITCGPSQSEVFTAFGHDAIRVYDSIQGLDYAYNYGVFDFNKPNFYLNFARGIPFYMLGVYSYSDFRDIYIYYNRSVTEQVLNLSQSQKQAIYDYLEWNAQPENENYRYDYFYNNCATKVRDVFANVLKDSIQFDGSFITTNYSIRDLTDIYLKQQPWGDLGIDICLGLPMDKKATVWEYMFLPDYVESSFDHVSINKNGEVVPIVEYKRPIYLTRPASIPESLVHPWTVFGGWLVLTIALSVYDMQRKKISKWFDIVLFGVTGLIGVLLLLLWTVTNHQAAANNFNLLWALPTHLFVIVITRKKSAPFLQKYYLGVTVLSVLLLITWVFLPQHLNIFLLPMVASFTCRAWVISRLL